jgi:hypothetical protein
MEEQNNENVEYCEATIVEEPCEDCESRRTGFGLLKALAVTVICAGGAALIAEKTGKLENFKASRREKRIAKLEAKLEKAYYTLPSGDSKEETEKETEE